jgi:hypothetical protein
MMNIDNQDDFPVLAKRVKNGDPKCLADKDFDIPSRTDALFGADILPSLIRPHAGVEYLPGL